MGKFLSVKAVVFFTWWQSLGISILFQMGMIPHYAAVDDGREWTSEAVAKGLQDYLICIEMFVAAIVHTFVFPHTDYLDPLGAINHRHHMANGSRRLGRKGRLLGSRQYRKGDDRSACSKSSGGLEVDSLANELELGTYDSATGTRGGHESILHNNEGGSTADDRVAAGRDQRLPKSERDDIDQMSSNSVTSPKLESPPRQRQGFVRALLDSTVPRDVFDETVGIVKGDFHVEKKTLLHHAATSDEYDLFSKSSKRRLATSKSSVRVTRGHLTRGKLKHDAAHLNVPDSIIM